MARSQAMKDEKSPRSRKRGPPDGWFQSLPRRASSSPQIQLLEEIIPLVVDHDERREILDLDAPDRFHAEFGVFEHLDLLDAVLREPRGRAPDRAEVKAAVFGAGLAHLRRAVALGEHHHRAARGLELIDEGIHPPRRRRPERRSE